MLTEFFSLFKKNPKDWDGFKQLIERGLNPNQINLVECGRGFSRDGAYAGLASWAVWAKNQDFFEWIMDRGIDVQRELSAVLYRVDIRDSKWLKLIFDYGFDPKGFVSDKLKYGLMHKLSWALAYDLDQHIQKNELLQWFVPSLDTLLQAGVDINARTEQGDTILVDVISDDGDISLRLEVMDLLLDRNARPDIPATNGCTPFHASLDHDLAFLERCFRVPCGYAFGRDEDGDMPLHSVIRVINPVEKMRLLLQNHCDVDAYAIDLETTLCMVLFNKFSNHRDNLEIAKLLLEYGANPWKNTNPDPFEPLIVKVNKDPDKVVSSELLKLINDAADQWKKSNNTY